VLYIEHACGVTCLNPRSQATDKGPLTTDSCQHPSSAMYSQKLLDHFRHPRNVGEIAEATAVVETSNPVCGDLMKLWAVVRDGKIADVKFKVAGCVPAVACGSWLTEAIIDKPLGEVAALTPDQIAAGLGGLPPASKHAAILASDSLKRLLDKLR
jgi:nitrogen fixation NifU-like protein